MWATVVKDRVQAACGKGSREWNLINVQFQKKSGSRVRDIFVKIFGWTTNIKLIKIQARQAMKNNTFG